MDDAARNRLTQVATAGEYVALLREVRRRSGLTYREITRLASAAGHWLPPSTLATMLGRTTLPRERTVVALLVACGTTPADVRRWVETRRNIEARLGERDRWENQAAPTTSSPPAAPQQAANSEPVVDGGPAATADRARTADRPGPSSARSGRRRRESPRPGRPAVGFGSRCSPCSAC